ncbi:hypothetical protein [Streptomyces aureocirculatus]|uniref:hypothetical protein n=1 Tax=Streptomyces aureocirculatus TaxID=67275 RepID=UPI0012FF1F30|nr:hypothetical protein [Streptomyces aureocirculatus]
MSEPVLLAAVGVDVLNTGLTGRRAHVAEAVAARHGSKRAIVVPTTPGQMHSTRPQYGQTGTMVVMSVNMPCRSQDSVRTW